MSRFGDDGDGEYPAHWWQIDLERALTSGRGQRKLLDIKAGLLAMPERELIEDELVRWDDEEQEGGVCAVGAYAAWWLVKGGLTWKQAFAALRETYGLVDDPWQTQAVGQAHGLTRTVAYELGWLNDEAFSSMSPEARWMAMLDWIHGKHLPGHYLPSLHAVREAVKYHSSEATSLLLDAVMAAACAPYQQPSRLEAAP